ncbi:MAG TPA: Calx-beta domain-containing protein, partial [Allosphingosinicella sp.]|nr:Calx-beta domain-containing protein [Allosphingosinicella sp.]
VSTTEDSVTEPDETMSLTLSNATNGVNITDSSAKGTILNDDGFTETTSTFRISDAQYYEGNGIIFEIYRTGPTNTGYSTSIHYDTSDGSAHDSGNKDYQQESGTVTFNGNEIYKTISIYSDEDSLDEGNETFNVTITPQIAGDTLFDGIGLGTIIDDD